VKYKVYIRIGRTDTHEEVNIRFTQLCKRSW